MRARGSVLLLEDDSDTVRTTVALIKSFGYSVTYATNRAAALHALESSEIDIIMLDLIMPRLDGLYVLEHLQLTKPHLLRRVIVTTGIPDRYINNLDRGRICGVIEKPLDPGQLERLLSHCMTRVVLPSPGGEVPQTSD